MYLSINKNKGRMRLNFSKFLVIVLLAIAPLGLSAERTKMRHEAKFVVKTPDKAKNIATRFHIPAAMLTQLNKPLKKRQTVFAGRELRIPVWFKKKKTTETGKRDGAEFSVADYELDIDSLDANIKTDFINVSDIEADTLRRIAINKELAKIDRRMTVLAYRIDSMQGATDKVTTLNGEPQTETQIALHKMQIAKERHYGKMAIGGELDTVSRMRKVLQDERYKINMRVEEYENLITNASYNESNKEERTKYEGSTTRIVINEWGDDPDKGRVQPIRKRQK
jgi:hypothetical protein